MMKPNILSLFLVALSCFYLVCSASAASGKFALTSLVVGGMTMPYPPSSPLTADPIFVPVGNYNPFPYGPVFYANFLTEDPNSQIEIFLNDKSGNANISLGSMAYDTQNQFWFLSSDIQVAIPSVFTMKVQALGTSKNFHIAVVAGAIENSPASGKDSQIAQFKTESNNPFIFLTYLVYASMIMPYYPSSPLMINPIAFFVSGVDTFPYGPTIQLRLNINDPSMAIDLYSWNPLQPGTSEFIATSSPLQMGIWGISVGDQRPRFPVGYEIRVNSTKQGTAKFNLWVQSLF